MINKMEFNRVTIPLLVFFLISIVLVENALFSLLISVILGTLIPNLYVFSWYMYNNGEPLKKTEKQKFIEKTLICCLYLIYFASRIGRILAPELLLMDSEIKFLFESLKISKECVKVLCFYTKVWCISIFTFCILLLMLSCIANKIYCKKT